MIAIVNLRLPFAQLPTAPGVSQPAQPPMPPPLPPLMSGGGLPPAPPPLPPALGPRGPPDGPSVRGALLSSITDGKKLKKVERPTADASDGGGGNELLEAIRCAIVCCVLEFKHESTVRGVAY